LTATTFNWNVRVYYEDTDIAGVVYHANYLRFFERAEIKHALAYLRLLENPHDAATLERVRAEVKKLTDAFPVYA